jgi:outer membrane protein assembly factor BamB
MNEKSGKGYRHMKNSLCCVVGRLVPVLLVATCGFLPACPSNECTDGNCYGEVDPEWGSSALFALNPATGESRWEYEALGVPGEKVNILGLQDNAGSVVVEATDPCFAEPKLAAFRVSNGEKVDVIHPVVPISGDEVDTSCSDVMIAGVASFQNVSGVCVGVETLTGDMLAINPLDNSEFWRSAVGATDIFASGNVLLAFGTMGDDQNVSYVVKRVAATTGQLLWQRFRPEAMRPLGANGQYVFLLDSHPFALSAVTGDDGWTFELGGWLFDPTRDSGLLLGGILYIQKQYVFESECGSPQTLQPIFGRAPGAGN